MTVKELIQELFDEDMNARVDVIIKRSESHASWRQVDAYFSIESRHGAGYIEIVAEVCEEDIKTLGGGCDHD